MQTFRRFALLLGITLFCALHSVRASAIAVPLIQLRTGHIAVSVRVNGQGPFRLVFDTGSPVTFISNRAAKLAKITTDEGSRMGLMGLGGQTKVKTFDVGGALVKEMGILIMDHPVITMLSEFEGQIDGIVGMSFFSRFRTTIDYAEKKITLVPGKYQPKDVMQSMMNRLLNRDSGKVVLASAGQWGFQAVKEGTEAGVVVTQVYAKSAADSAGLQPHDRILTLDGRWTDTLNDLIEAAARVPIGHDAPLEILRDGKKQTLILRPRLGL